MGREELSLLLTGPTVATDPTIRVGKSEIITRDMYDDRLNSEVGVRHDTEVKKIGLHFWSWGRAIRKIPSVENRTLGTANRPRWDTNNPARSKAIAEVIP